MYTIAYTSQDNEKTVCLDKSTVPAINNLDKFFYYDAGFSYTSRKLVCSFNNEVHRLRKSGADIILEKLQSNMTATTVYTFSGQDWTCGALLKIENLLIIAGINTNNVYYYIWNGSSITHSASCSNFSSTSIEDVNYSNNRLYIMANNTMYDGFLGSGILRISSINTDLVGASFFNYGSRVFCSAPKVVRIYEVINSTLYEIYYNNLLTVSSKRSSGVTYNGKCIIAFPHNSGTAYLEYNGTSFSYCSLTFPVCSVVHAVSSDFYVKSNNDIYLFMNCDAEPSVLFKLNPLNCLGNISSTSSSWNYI